jgi:PKD repeat protein
MKKLIFTFLVSFLFFNITAQVDRELVLVEIATGTWCGFCQGAAMGADDLHENGDPVAIIENHNGDSFSNSDSDGRNSYYGISGYPTAKFDGSYGQYVGGSGSQSMYNNYLPIVQARMGIQTSFIIEIGGGGNEDGEYELTVTVEKVGEYDNADLTLRLALTESHIPFNWLGQTEVNFVNRVMLPDHYGTDFVLEDVGDNEAIELDFTFNNSWDIEECEIVAFIQDDVSKEVLHSAKIMILDLGDPVPTFAAGFFATPQVACEAPAVIDFYDDCIGEPNQWMWSFPGGIPETSLEEDPTVVYTEVGSYDVQLIVTDGTDWDTLFIENYITVNNLPEVSWEEVPELCNEDWEPHELTEGQPEGGIYSGEHIIEGLYFDSDGLEAGSYTVTYTFADDDGCENSADYEVMVVNCVGMGENEAVGLDFYPNPTSGMINITLTATQFNNADIRVIDAVGKEVYRQNGVNVNGTFTTSIDLGSQPQGIYFIVVNGDEQRITKKVFVRH